jgi:two-component system, NtrC family, nitrogen regulation sensor histidine kinase GlnL
MVLKNLIKARKGHAEPLSDDVPLVESGLLPGFEALPTVVLVLDKRTLRVAFANPSAEAMLDLSRRQLAQMAWSDLFSNADELLSTIASIAEHRFHATRLDASLERPGREPLNVHVVVGFLESTPDYVLLELFENERHLRSDREERIHDLTAVN